MPEYNIWDLLKKRYPENEYALMEEVRDAAGFHASRSADYIAVNLWPSRGLSITGIELKSFRSDWLSELKKPAKAENIFQYCDYFYLLTSDETVAKLEEIPSAWGWICVKGASIRVMKEAPKQTPVAISRHFMAAMLKRAVDKSGWIKKDTIADEIKKAEERGIEKANREFNYQLEVFAKVKLQVDEFEKASGIRIDRYSDVKKIGKAVEFLKSGGAENVAKELVNLKGRIDFISKSINAQLEDDIFKQHLHNIPDDQL